METAASLGNLGIVYQDQGKLEEAREYFQRALRIQERHYGKDHVEMATPLGNLGTVYRRQGKLEQAREHIERAVRIQECHYGKDHVETAVSLGNLGNVYLQQGKLKQAEEYFERALRITERHYGKDHVEITTPLGNLGTVYRWQGKLEQARGCYERVLRIQASHFPAGHPKLNNIENCLQQLSNISFNSALAADQKFAPATENIPAIAVLKSESHKFNQQAMRHYRAEKYTQAIEFFQQALRLQQQISSVPHEEVATLHFNIGSAYLLQKNYLLARTSLQSAYEMRLRLLGTSHLATQKAHSRLQECQHAIEQHVTSSEIKLENEIAHSSTVESTARSVFSTTDLDVHQLSQEDMKRYRAKEYKEAIEFFQQALSLQQQASNPSHEEVATLHFNIGSAYFFQKDYLSAKTALQSAYDMRLTLLGTSHLATQKAQSRLQECQRAIEQYPPLAETERASENKTESSVSAETPVRSIVFSTVGGTPNNPEAQPQNTSANANKPKAKSNPKPLPFKREGES